ncbi:uncharacterized protein LAESUDRAFT_765581 [Laetiporus sulphureus 93-53]|uniref:Uncharacterized protein n=1 Tax=Laetiporus sulphureus 93-53 TaxID=1314785 RepID=A0A165APC8_9APHY|nr:uncharacterized protein LAESUDRAFT_765581 [Laetiporus sulphureus 93-53]KZS99398.1 hypothetical protein LAESUDRAFT_765581 [Laetiporus sulphureus 93-53]
MDPYLLLVVCVTGAAESTSLSDSVSDSVTDSLKLSSLDFFATGGWARAKFFLCLRHCDGFDGRTETSFRPAALSSYNHGSADGIAVITSFICQQVDDACGANDLADAFNAVFGIATDFAAVPEYNDQGQTVTATATASA